MTQDAIEKERSGLAKYTEDRNNEILGLNNELARLQTKLDEVKASAMKWCVRTITTFPDIYICVPIFEAKSTLLLNQITFRGIYCPLKKLSNVTMQSCNFNAILKYYFNVNQYNTMAIILCTSKEV